MTVSSTSGVTDTIMKNYLANQAASATSTTGSSSATTASLTGTGGSLTTFLKILTTQLQHQDPTAASDTNQFTQELVQFAGAEQQINTNSKLDTITTLLQGSNGASSALGYIGKYVSLATTDKLALQGGSSEMSYSLDSAASSVNIVVKDASGNVVDSLKGTGNSGTNYVSWNGKDANGNQLPDGVYTFVMDAQTSYGTQVNVSNKSVIAKVTSVMSNTDGTTGLGIIGSLSTNNDNVQAVFDPNSLPAATAI